MASPENIPTNILSDRLARLLEHGIIEQLPVEGSLRRLAYQLTTKGKELMPVLKAMRDWGLKWESGSKVLLANQRPSNS